MVDSDRKAQNQARFGQYAAGYVHSWTHAQGADLERLVELAQPQADWLALDVATGGGHTALRFAPHVGRMIATDLTPKMLWAARDFAQPQAPNMAFSAADAENLPFAGGVFDLVLCRIAPHHFPDVFRFVCECARVLKHGGVLLIQDHVHPDDAQAARYIDAFETLRDPSHHKVYADYEWRGLFLDAGLTIEATDTFSKRHDLLDWAQRQACTPEVVERLQVMLLQAPPAAAVHLMAEHAGTDKASFCNHHILIMGRKP